MTRRKAGREAAPMRTRPGTPFSERVMSCSVPIPETGCWIWLLVPDRQGYGYVKINRRHIGAHRLSYMAFVGPIPEGMTVDHVCFTPLCVNPDHLRLLTNVENAVRTRRALANVCRRGHELTPENSYSSPGAPGRRQCLTCQRAYAASRWATRRNERKSA